MVLVNPRDSIHDRRMRFATRQQTTSNLLEETDRPNVVRTPTFYADLGFTLYVTSGTGSVIKEAGIEVNILPKLASGQRPNVIDLMKNKIWPLSSTPPRERIRAKTRSRSAPPPCRIASPS